MSDPSRKMSYLQRARSIPHKHFFRSSLYWAMGFYIMLACVAAALIGLYKGSTEKNAYLLIALVFAAIFVWVLGYVTRKKATCPLCKGTPLLDNRASTHVKATRIFPFNYGTTNILKALIICRIRCHFCGTPFDMLKKNPTAKEK